MAKILHFSTELSWRGGEQQLVYLYSELHKLKQTQLILCSKGSKLEAHCRLRHLNYVSMQKRGGASLKSFFELRKICAEFQPDLWHLHDSRAHTHAFVHGLLQAKKIPLILSRKVEFPIKNSFLSRRKYNYSGIKKILCVSEAVKNVLAKTVLDPEKLEVVYDGVNLEEIYSRPQEKSRFFREKFEIPGDYKIVGNIAALEDSKGYHTFIDVASLLIQRGLRAKFIAVGEGSQREALMQYALRKRVASDIIFAGFHNEIPDKITGLDVMLFPSKQEGFGSTILTAFASGVPVVATKAGGIPELIIPGETGFLREVDDAEGLAHDVEFLLENPVARSKIAEQAQARAKDFSTQFLGERTLRIYQSVLGL